MNEYNLRLLQNMIQIRKSVFSAQNKIQIFPIIFVSMNGHFGQKYSGLHRLVYALVLHRKTRRKSVSCLFLGCWEGKQQTYSRFVFSCKSDAYNANLALQFDAFCIIKVRVKQCKLKGWPCAGESWKKHHHSGASWFVYWFAHFWAITAFRSDCHEFEDPTKNSLGQQTVSV